MGGTNITSTVGRRCLAVLGVLLYLLLASPSGSASPYGEDSPVILVGLFRAGEASFTSAASWTMGFDHGCVSLGPGDTVTLTQRGGLIAWEVQGYTASTGSSSRVLLSPGDPQSYVTVTKEDGAGFCGLSFRGSLYVMAEESQLLVANAVQIEEYVVSVVGAEMPGGFPLEAKRAQAIAARSYAAYRTGFRAEMTPRYYVEQFRTLMPSDVLIWASDQVYRGVDAEDPSGVEASRSTWGMLLMCDGAPLPAYYHADAGGCTETVRYVWGGDLPSLVSVREAEYESPYSLWTAEVTAADLGTALLGQARSADGVPEYLVGTQSGESGRWYLLGLGTDAMEVSVRGTDLRKVLPEVKSTLFGVWTLGGETVTSGCLAGGMSYSVIGKDGLVQTVRLGDAGVLGGKGVEARCDWGAFVQSAMTADGPLRFSFVGSGWGHGVGMSQWGARGLAQSGEDGESIVAFYYPRATLERWW